MASFLISESAYVAPKPKFETSCGPGYGVGKTSYGNYSSCITCAAPKYQAPACNDVTTFTTLMKMRTNPRSQPVPQASPPEVPRNSACARYAMPPMNYSNDQCVNTVASYGSYATSGYHAQPQYLLQM